MFGTLKTFIVSLVEDTRSQRRLANKDCRLAIAALLVRVATVSGEMSQARRGKLYVVLKSVFGLDYLAAQLIDGAAASERRTTDLYYFTRQLNEILDHRGRRRVVAMMWEILYADGRVNECEANIIWRTSDLLGVSTRERIELRQRIAANGTRPACGYFGGSPTPTARCRDLPFGGFDAQAESTDQTLRPRSGSLGSLR